MARNPRQDADGRGRRYGDRDATIERVDEQRNSPRQDGTGREAQTPTDIPKPGWMAIGKRTMAEVKDDNVVLLAAGVAFYFFLALFPALIAMVTIYGLVMSPEQVESQLQSLAGALPADAASLITDQVRSATTSAGGGLTIGLIVSLAAVLWAASGGMNGLIKGINVAYGEVDSRKFFIKRGLAILLTLGGILFFAIAIALVAVLPAVLGSIGLGSIGQTDGAQHGGQHSDQGDGDGEEQDAAEGQQDGKPALDEEFARIHFPVRHVDALDESVHPSGGRPQHSGEGDDQTDRETASG